MREIDLNDFAVGKRVRLNHGESWGGVLGGEIVTVSKAASDAGSFEVTNKYGKTVEGCYVGYWTPVPTSVTSTVKPSLILDGRFYRGSRSTALRRIGTIVRLHKEGFSVRETAAKLGLSKSAVHRVIQKAA